MIGIFARHPVAPNLLMAVMVLAGAVALQDLNRQFFPEVASARARVGVTWAGAGAEDVASRITIPVHEELRPLDGLDRITSLTRDGWTNLHLEFREGTDMAEAVDAIKDRLDAMRDLPESADKPEVTKSQPFETVAVLLLTGPEDRTALQRLGREIERGLLEAGIDRVQVSGAQDEEVAIRIASVTLRALGLSLGEIAQRIAGHSLDMPAGTAGREELATQLRALGQRRSAIDFERIPIVIDEHGRRLALGDIATIERRPRPDQVEVLHEGRPALVLALKRSASSDTLHAGEILRDWLERTRPGLPPGVELLVLDEPWAQVRERIALLVRNGGGGLVLVLATLFLALGARLAFWVALGIPVSFMAALAGLHAAGGSIDMVSLFALIMTAGIIVDDAIMVGEDGLTHYQGGAEPVEAAERGARRMFVPVMCSSLTTISAFVPLLFVGGFIGHLMFQIPLVVICVVAASLVECFLILPGHLRGSFPRREHEGRGRAAMARAGKRLRERVYRPVVRRAVAAPATVLAIGLAMLILSAGAVQGGLVRFHFFPTPEESFISAKAQFAAGTPRARVRAYALHLEEALREAEREIGEEVVEISRVAAGADASVAVELVDSDRRQTRNARIMEAWERHVRSEPGVESLVVTEAAAGPPGSDVDAKLTGSDAAVLKAAAEAVKARLAAVPGTLSVADNLTWGPRQLIFGLTPAGEALGLSVAEVGRQLRAAYDGHLVQLFQEGGEEIEVRVMLADEERNRLAGLGAFGIVAPSGKTAPLDTVVDLESRRGFDELRHADGRLAINVTAGIDRQVTTAGEVNRLLHERILPEVAGRYPIGYALEGRSRTERRTLGDLQTGLVAALALIFLVLAWVFRSYGLPLVVMTAIPFGLVGVLVGHLVMGLDASVVSILGFFALAGIVVNNSIILVTFYQALRDHMPGRAAIEEAACRRLRAVLLTSATTIAGLTPLMFETSLQAQFLVPMAVSIAFGLAFSTLIVLFLVPALLVYHDRVSTWRTARAAAAPELFAAPRSGS